MPYKQSSDRRESQLQHRIKNRIKSLDYLSTHPCIDCNESDPIVLDFDHRDSKTKKFNISRAVGGSHRGWDLIKREIDKCDVRCANCHRRRTYKQFEYHKHILT